MTIFDDDDPFDSDYTESGEPEREPPEQKITPVLKFKLPLYLRVMSNKTIRPVNKRDYAQFVILLTCEYPRYEEEIQAKREHTLYDEFRSLHYVDIDGLAEWRVRRCLRSWTFHTVLPGFTKKIFREGGGELLTEDSMMAYRALPPLVRKEISIRIWNSLGSP